MQWHGSPSGGCEANDALEGALVANEGLVHWTVRRQWLGRLAYEDAVQEGRIALWRALKHYDARRGTLSSYAEVAIRHAVWQAARRAHRAAHERIDDEPIGLAPDMAAEMDRVITRVHVRDLVAHLPKRLRLVVVLRYGLDGRTAATFPEIGRTLGVTKQRAHQLHTDALLHLADPAFSAPLRSHLGRNTRTDYQSFLARRRAWQRMRRGG
jgi:RNA polymerase sigma factor (sigma-70 family)